MAEVEREGGGETERVGNFKCGRRMIKVHGTEEWVPLIRLKKGLVYGFKRILFFKVPFIF